MGKTMTMERLRLIGYWQDEREPHWPDPTDWIDPDWDPHERDRLARYLQGGWLARASAGFSQCRICGERNGSSERTDFALVWPEGLAHYVLTHSVRLPQVVMEVFSGRIDPLGREAIDDGDWWRGHRTAAVELHCSGPQTPGRLVVRDIPPITPRIPGYPAHRQGRSSPPNSRDGRDSSVRAPSESISPGIPDPSPRPGEPG